VRPSLADLLTPGQCALLLQEVQRGVVGPGGGLGQLAQAAETAGLVPRLRQLTAAARLAGVPVLHCTAADLKDGFGANHNARLFGAARQAGTLEEADGEKVQPVDGLWADGDLVLPRFHGLSPLTGAQLDSLLRNQGVRTVVVTGVSLNVAIPNLVFDAVNRAYQVVVATDAVVGVPIEYGQQVIEHTLRPLATLATVAQLVEVWSAPT
jgi:nicotinamidase-related amidase